MMDAAEQWLRDNDVRYETTRRSWHHIQGEHYSRPSREVLSADPSVHEPDIESGERRACDVCGFVFPVRAVGRGRNRRYCDRACKQVAYRLRRGHRYVIGG